MTLDLFSPSERVQQTLSVAELNHKVKDLLELHFPLVRVEGEISNLSRPASGHWYFTLKDTQAQVSCAMFNRRNSLVKFKPAVGDHVKLRARVSLYEGRGDYQLIVEHVEQAGFGLLQKRFEELKQGLLDEGLFDSKAKQALPTRVQHLAVVTSPTGAAIRDVLSVLRRRFPAMEVSIIPSTVQGDNAPQQLIAGLNLAAASSVFDAILLCRGGGSIEDLWAFNSEALAREIFACGKPVISAVGHEVDFTIADFVADVRAATPSAAAELLSPDQETLLAQFKKLQTQLVHRCRQQMVRRRERLLHLRKRLQHPRDKLEQWFQRFDDIEGRLTRAIDINLAKNQQHLQQQQGHLRNNAPNASVQRYQQVVQNFSLALARNMALILGDKQQAVHHAIAQLDLVSPLATIHRGYAIVRDTRNDILHRVDQVSMNDGVTITVGDGEIEATVNSTIKKTISSTINSTKKAPS